MEKLLFVGLGGFLGTIARYTLGGLVARAKNRSAFPCETLLVNVLGCLGIGFLAGLAETRGFFSGSMRAFLFVGLLGGFTTFSTFGYETVQLLRNGQTGSALWSMSLQLLIGLGGVWIGDAIARVLGSA
jgi:CrcB protein